MSAPPPARFTRRTLLKVAGGALLASLSAAGYALRVEPRWLDVTQIDIPIANLAPHLIGRRLAQLSDIHLSPYMSVAHLDSAIDMVNSLAPDWLFLTGDFVGRDVTYATGLIDPLRKLDMPAYAVWGNHDHWTSTTTVAQSLAESSVTLLENAGIRLDSNLWLAGSDNIWGGRPDLNAALAGARPDDTTILLVHEPDFFDRVLEQDAPVSLQLSGHTHGGQVRLPQLSSSAGGLRSWAPVLPRYGVRYPIGHHTIDNRHVYTNRGLGVWPVRIRLNCRPELTIFTLQAA
ncbi:MAG: metallophosphoesterase [Litorilinea sp.]